MINSNIKTNSAGIDITSKATGFIEGGVIERRQGGYGVSARDEAVVIVKNLDINMTGTNPNVSGDFSFSPAAIAARKSKIELDDIRIKDLVSTADLMKGIYADRGSEVNGKKVTYQSGAKKTLGVQLTDNSSVTLTDSVFELNGEGSRGVFSGGGTFTAIASKFSSKGNLIEIYKEANDETYINLNKNSEFKSDEVLLRNESSYEYGLFGGKEAFFVADNSQLAGRIEGGVHTDVTLQNQSDWSYSGYSSFRNLSLNDSTIRFNKPTQGQKNTLEVDVLEGNGGVIELWTEYKGDSSKSDIVRVNLEAKGKTALRFKKLGGDGEQTVNGIKVVDAMDWSPSGGPKATTTSDAFFIDPGSDGYRKTTKTIASGAFEYSLLKPKNGAADNESWFLSSQKVDIIDPPVIRNVRPEPDIYFANRISMLNMQQHQLKQRVIDNGQSGQVSWIRVENNQERFDNQFGNRRKSSMNLVHFGTDVFRRDWGDNGQLQIGVMGLIGHNESKTKSTIVTPEISRGVLNAKGKTDGYNIGAYATWYQKPGVNTGAYIDTWLMHGWFNNSVKGDDLAKVEYDSRALSASLETGYGFNLPFGGDKQQYSLQPQAQIVFSQTHSDDVFDSTKSLIQHENGNQVAYRFGIRFQGDIQQVNQTILSPFAELNYWHQPEHKDIRFDQLAFKDKTPSDLTEMALGLRLKLKTNWDISGQFNYKMGSQNYQRSAFQLGARYQW